MNFLIKSLAICLLLLPISCTKQELTKISLNAEVKPHKVSQPNTDVQEFTNHSKKSFRSFDQIISSHKKAVSKYQHVKPSRVKLPFGLEANEQQKEQLEKINEEFSGRLLMARKSVATALTPKERRLRVEAFTLARSKGLTGKELTESINKALRLTPESAARFEFAEKNLKEINKEINQKVINILTLEQKQQIKANALQHGS